MRDYRELSATRLAQVADANLEISVLKARIEQLDAQVEDWRDRFEAVMAQRDEFNTMHANANQALDATNSELDRVTEELASVEGLVKAHKALFNRIYWWLDRNQPKGDLTAIHTFQELIGAIGELKD